MRLFRSARWLLLALLLPLFPAMQARAGVFISVGFAPPVLPVYVQPPCPEPNLIWVPGYWAYGPDGYYWVPGAWVPAPYEGALWTPPYWGWDDSLYVFHPGYWGWNVGYYGGVNYGYGYYGVGFIGGRWHDRDFEYNTAVVRVNETIIHTTYIDRTVIREHEVVRDSRVAYSGGPGGIRHDPTSEERVAMREQHLQPTQAQQQRVIQARSNRAAYFNANHGRPQQVAIARPLPAQHVAPPPARAQNGFRPEQPGARPNRNEQNGGRTEQPQYQRPQQQRPEPQRPTPQYQRPEPQRPQPQYQRPEPQYQRPQQQRPEPQYQRPEQQRPQQRPEPQYQRPAPQEQRPQPRPEPQYRPAPQQQRPQPRPEPQYRPAPQQRPESRPAPEQRPQRQPQEPRRENRPPKEPQRR